MPVPPSAPHEPASRATVWSWLGFLVGLALYLTVSATFDWMPKDDMPRGLWFTLGLVPAFIGFSIGLVRAAGRDDDDAQRDDSASRSSP
jgi:cadmium resistance protein CadD (predicted permease)